MPRRCSRSERSEYDHAKQMTADQMISLYSLDHDVVRKAEGGSDHFSNLVPRLRSEHKAKTLRDIIEIAKNKRIKRKHGRHLALMLAKNP